MAKKSKKSKAKKSTKAKWKLPKLGKSKPAKKAKARKAKTRKVAHRKMPPPEAKESKPEAGPWHAVTDAAPEGKVLEIDGLDGRKPELAVKTGGVWRAHYPGKRTKPVTTMAAADVVAPRRWRSPDSPKV